MVTAAARRATALVAMGGDDSNNGNDGDGATGDGATGYNDNDDGNER